MRPRGVVLVAGLVTVVATGQLIANVAVGQEPQDAPERAPRVSVSVELAPTVGPAPKAPATKQDAATRDRAPLEMSVVEVATRHCPDGEDAKTRLGLLERSAVHSLCD